MKVNNIGQCNMNFGAIPLYEATLGVKKAFSRKITPMKAIVSIMEKTDLDRPGMDYLKWDKTSYGGAIIDEFASKMPHKLRRFLLVDMPDAAPKEQVKALALYTVGFENINLQLLQSENQLKWFKKTKGAGSLIIYALTKIAEILGKEAVCVDADRAAFKFYKKIGMKKSIDSNFREEGEFFILTKNMFKAFQQKMEEKFNITA